MKRHFAEACRVKVLWMMVGLAISAGSALGGIQNKNLTEAFLVEAEDSVRLLDFASVYGSEVEPLISYPNPSRETLERFGNYYILTFTKSISLEMLRTEPWVIRVEPAQSMNLSPDPENTSELGQADLTELSPYVPNDPLFSYQWDKRLTETNWVWSKTKGDPDVLVAFLDSGIDTTHTELTLRVVDGYNFVEGNEIIYDENGHGTKTAGVAVAGVDNWLGIAGTAGDASIMAVKVVNQMGNVRRSDLIRGIIYAVDKGAEVINVSMGFADSNNVEFQAVEYAWEQGVFITASAGNKGTFEPNHYPSSYEYVMSVGGSTDEDNLASFSNHGFNVDVYAPGRSVWVTLAGGGYGTSSGTSYASPQVAGLAALLYSAHPESTNRQIWDGIIQGADTINTDQGKILRINSRKTFEAIESSGALTDEASGGFTVMVSALQKDQIVLDFDTNYSGEFILRVFDATGRTVYTQEFLSVDAASFECKLPLPAGTYFWSVKTDSQTCRGKVNILK